MDDEPNALDQKLIPPGVRIEIPLLPASIPQLQEIAGILAALSQKLDVLTHSEDTERHIKIDAWFLVREAREKILLIKKHRLGEQDPPAKPEKTTRKWEGKIEGEDGKSETLAPLIRLKN